MTDAVIQHNLKQSGLRPTRQRLMIGSKLWANHWAADTRHFTAEQLHNECLQDGMSVSMATIYNTLHQFVSVGLLREVVVNSGCSCFDTNVVPHHHFLNEETGHLTDIPAHAIDFKKIPAPEAGQTISSVDVVIRVRSTPEG